MTENLATIQVVVQPDVLRQYSANHVAHWFLSKFVDIVSGCLKIGRATKTNIVAQVADKLHRLAPFYDAISHRPKNDWRRREHRPCTPPSHFHQYNQINQHNHFQKKAVNNILHLHQIALYPLLCTRLRWQNRLQSTHEIGCGIIFVRVHRWEIRVLATFGFRKLGEACVAFQGQTF